MQQRVVLGQRIEIPRPRHQLDVLIEKCAAVDVNADVVIFGGRRHKPSDDQNKDEQSDQVGENALDAFDVKIGKTEGITNKPAKNDPRDEISGDRKKNVDAVKATGHPLREGMKDQNRKNRESTQPRDVFAPIVFLLH